MRKYLLPFVFSVIIIFGCNPATNVITEYLNASNLTEQAFTIQTDRDTTIKTTEDIIISIPANSIKTDGNRVTLEVKEALTMADILKAGLTTQSGKDILSSDGMFYIGTKEQSTITGAIHIKLPTANANKNMQLYKGVEKDGKIDWQSPTTITKTITPLADSGEVLFKTNCSSCHAIDKKLTGPALAGMDLRKSRKWDHAFIKNNFRLLDCGDEYALALYHQYGSAMPVFEGTLSDRQIDAIIRYIDKVSNNNVQQENSNDYLDEDSCKFYRAYYYGLKSKRDSLIIDNGAMAKFERKLPTASANTADSNIDVTVNLPLSHVDVPYYYAEYYQFDIKAFGWYNLDFMVKEWNSLPESNLVVNIADGYSQRIKIYLIIPSLKIFTEGGYLQNNKDFGFDENDGKTRLPQNANAWIMAVSEQNEKVYYAQEHFITTTSQIISISLKETDRKSILSVFESLRLDGASLTVEKTKNFEGVRGVNTELQGLQEKLKHCACSEVPVADSTVKP